MVSSNKTLDRFFLEVQRRVFPDIPDEELQTFRRFCNLTIFTSGTSASETDSFCNVPHIDKNDVFFKEFQNAAKELVFELRSSHAEDYEISRDINYLEELARLCGGYAVPTTCGYSIIQQPGTTDELHSYFAMIGLGVAIKICNQSYHYFHGPSFLHCTPAAICINDNKQIVTYSNGNNNVVGWGGAQSVRREVYNRYSGPPVPRLFPAAFYHWLRTCNNPRAIEEAERRGLIRTANARRRLNI